MGYIEFSNLIQHFGGCQVWSLNLTSSLMDNRLQPRRLAQRLLAGATVVTVLCSQYTTLLMSSQSVPKAHWNPQETQALLDYLVAHKSEGKGAESFKDPTFNAALASITPLLTLGPLKTLNSCKNKWASVCHFAQCCVQDLELYF
jgi:hypothetical protein